MISCEVDCYANDTLVLVTADTPEEAIARASLQVRKVIRLIRGLGLTVAAFKMEVVLFHHRRDKWRIPWKMTVQVEEDRIPLAPVMKYLGLYLDACLEFGEHIRHLEEKMDGATRALARLMPNLQSPGERRRRLYANVFSSIALYDAPVWADTVLRSELLIARLRRMQRTYAVRVCCAYRMVSVNAVSLPDSPS